ncbi:focadhesin-like [Saccoglossus kowalevskii]
MLSTVSWFLNECSADHEESIAALALDSLHALCKSEVVDIRTTWNALSRKLNKDKRKVVNRKVCKLFSLVPVLNVETDEYEEFRDDIVTILWSYAKSYDPSISGAAYKALANFDEQEFRLDDLPENLSKEVKLRIKANRREYEDDRDEEEELEDLDIPGESYVKLMCQVHRDILKNFEMFLTSLVAQEIKAMPRGIHHSAMKGQNKAANQNRAVISIPSLMEKQYEKNRLPSLKQGLAAALLLCYDPTLDVGRDGKPARRHLVSFGRSYQQMLNVLLNEVPVQPAEWLRTMLMPQTWTSFMHGLFAAMLEGRRAELEMQQSHKHTEYSEEDLKIKQTTIWLWVRDKITDQLKSSAKGNPTTQSNSVMALAGLAVVMAKHAASIGQSETDAAHKLAPEHTNQSQWLAMVTDTLITVLDGNVAPKGRVFIMCQQAFYVPILLKISDSFFLCLMPVAELEIRIMRPFWKAMDFFKTSYTPISFLHSRDPVVIP